jgi:poly(3-hydroxyalkanoate) synthetase
MNDIYNEFIENYAKINQLYKQRFEVNQQWFNLLQIIYNFKGTETQFTN